jgi:hypothetical protein
MRQRDDIVFPKASTVERVRENVEIVLTKRMWSRARASVRHA